MREQQPFVRQEPVAPTAALPPSDHNKPPLNELIVDEFLADLGNHNGVDLVARLSEIQAREGALGPCNTEADTGRYADFIKLANAAVKAVEAVRAAHNAPLLEAQRALKGKADGLCATVAEAERRARNAVNDYMARERKRQDEELRAAQAEAQRLSAKIAEDAEAQRQAGIDVSVAPVVTVAAAKVKPAAVVGTLGAKASSRTSYDFKIKAVRQLPDAILTHAKVVEAIEKVIGQQVRGGVREMKGVEIFPVHSAQIR